MNALVHEESPDMSEPALAFLLRPQGSPPVDRSAGQVLEVAQVFGENIVDLRHYRRGDTVRIGMTDDFVVPVDLLPEDHFPVFTHDGRGWVAQLSPQWAGFIDQGDTRTDMHARADAGRVRLDEDEVMVFEVGQSLFVARTIWRSRRLPVPLASDVDVPMVLIAVTMGFLATVLGIVAAYVTPHPETRRNDTILRIVDLELYRPKPEPISAPARDPGEPRAGGGQSPRETKASRDPRPGNPGAQVARDKVEEIFGGIDALAESSLDADTTAGIKNLIGSHGTQAPGAGGLTAGRCLSAECTGIGVASGDGTAPWGNDDRQRGNGKEWGGDFKLTKAEARLDVEGTPTMIGGIDKADVDNVVKHHLTYLRYCYSRELQKQPQLGGKVSIRFVIAGDGSVSAATVSRSTLGHPPTESCMTNKFLQMQFPALKGGGIAIITYPFVFASS
ncbi:MAG: AgmX/PglI C-terminal domain-containing protein [Deltaproteobacteria bacterium]|nr:AgmX/PglI C-terminal domain-containing protein [Deltaproteobacteria bacterium]